MILDKAQKNDYRDIHRLYLSAFPLSERAPYRLIKRRTLQGRGELLVLKEQDEFIGFFSLVNYEDLVYIYYFAIDEGKRGNGYGSRALALLKEYCKGKRVFLAREQLDENAANYDERVRRHNFYLKNGFEDMLPKIKEGGMVFDTMGYGGNVTAEEYRELVCAFMGKLALMLIDMRMIEE